MSFFRKAGNILGRTVNNHISSEISSSKPFIFQVIRCMSSSNVFVGGLSFSTDDTSLREVFSKYGEVYEAKVIIDRDTGRSRGFGFVNYSSAEEASAAIQALDQQELHGRRVRVNYANERPRGFGGGEGFRGGNFGGGYNSGGFGGNYGTGGGYNTSDGHGSGNYGTGGYGTGDNPNFGVNDYGNGVKTAANPTNAGESHTGGGNYAGNNNSDGGNLSSGGDGNFFGGASGGSGSNFYGSGSNSSASGGSDGFGDKFGGEESNGFGKDDPSEGNYRDDNDIPGNYADRRV